MHQIPRQRTSILLLFYLGYVFPLCCYDVCCHVQLNLFDQGSKMNPLLIYWIQLINFLSSYGFLVSNLICDCLFLMLFQLRISIGDLEN